MKLLAIESSGRTASVAVYRDGIVAAHMTLNDGRTHSEKLLPLVESALCALEMETGDLDAVAVSVGPGSFTGLRIGVASANALALAANIPVIEVSTLDALARSASGNILALLDALNNRAYAAYYEQNRLFWGPEAIELDTLCGRVPRDSLAVGDLSDEGAKHLGDIAFRREYPRADLVAQIAAEKLSTKDVVTRAKPMYLLKPQAQRALEERSR